MKKILLMSLLLSALFYMEPAVVSAEEQPEMIAEKMAIKFTRGVTNFFTSVAELPKQTIITSREMGNVGYVIGPLKGVGMTLYRGTIGFVEAVFCMVPQPGYYDPLMDPEFVWHGWEPKKDTTKPIVEQK